MASKETRNLRVLSILGTMLLSFVVSYAFLWERPPAEAAAVASVGSSAPQQVPVPMRRSSGTAVLATPASRSVPLPAATPAVAASVPSGQLPVMIQIRRWGGGFKYIGDVQNLDDKPLNLTLSVTSSVSGVTSRLALDLDPGEKRGFASGTSFDFRSGDELVLSSPAFPDRIERIP